MFEEWWYSRQWSWYGNSIPAAVLLVVVVMNSSHEYHQENLPLIGVVLLGE